VQSGWWVFLACRYGGKSSSPIAGTLGIAIDGQIINIASFPVVSAARASTTGAANISQRFAVVDGCAYLLQFSFQVSQRQTDIDTLALPRWELDWLDVRGAVLRFDSEAIEFSTRRESEEPTPWFYESLLRTSAGAVGAELRFIHPFPNEYALILEQVSFTPTVATLRNGNFGQWQGYSSARLPVGWSVISGWVDEERDSEQAQVSYSYQTPGGCTRRHDFGTNCRSNITSAL
jgi:hypothetical protein